MKHIFLTHSLKMAVLFLFLAVVSLAWAETESATGEISEAEIQDAVTDFATQEVAAEEAATELAVEEAIAVDAVADLAADEAASIEPVGLDIVMDGSSLESFQKDMEKVRETGGEKDYAQLKDAFDYLLIFDVGAKGKPEILASRLNGMTGNQILERVRYGRR